MRYGTINGLTDDVHFYTGVTAPKGKLEVEVNFTGTFVLVQK